MSHHQHRHIHIRDINVLLGGTGIAWNESDFEGCCFLSNLFRIGNDLVVKKYILDHLIAHKS